VNGAGLLTLPTDGEGWFSSAELGNGGVNTISFPVYADTRSIRAGMWWEDPGPLHVTPTLLIERHRDFDFELLDPNGEVQASSEGDPGCFERTTLILPASGTPLAGDWKIRVHARNVGLSPGIAYWTVFTSPSP
jgi:hypothetical protein